MDWEVTDSNPDAKKVFLLIITVKVSPTALKGHPFKVRDETLFNHVLHGCGGGLVVSVLVFYSGNPSSKSGWPLNFLHEKTN